MDPVRDRIDIGILTALQKNGRLSNKELAASVGLAPSSCLERVRRLERDGVIQGYRAIINPPAMGVQIQAMIAVRLHQQSRDDVVRFQDHARALPETLALYHMSGANDFLMHVGVRDTNHLRRVAIDDVMERPEVSHMETAVIFGHDRGDMTPTP